MYNWAQFMVSLWEIDIPRSNFFFFLFTFFFLPEFLKRTWLCVYYLGTLKLKKEAFLINFYMLGKGDVTIFFWLKKDMNLISHFISSPLSSILQYHTLSLPLQLLGFLGSSSKENWQNNLMLPHKFWKEEDCLCLSESLQQGSDTLRTWFNFTSSV